MGRRAVGLGPQEACDGARTTVPEQTWLGTTG